MRNKLIINHCLRVICLLLIACSVLAADKKCSLQEVYTTIEKGEYEKAIDLLENIIPNLDRGNQKGEAYFSLAYAHKHAGRPSKAIGFYLEATQHYTTDKCLSDTYENMGLIYKSFNQHEKAVHYFTKAANLEKPGSKRRMRKLFSRSTSLRRNDQTNEALDDLLEAEEIAFELADNRFRARIYDQIGLLYKFRGELGKAGSYFYQAMEMTENWETYHNYANLKKELGDTLLAEKYFLRAIEISKGNKRLYTFMDLGEMYHHWGKKERAVEFLNEALLIFEKSKSTTFNHIKLFEILAQTSEDPKLAGDYKDMAIAAYKNNREELKKSNELFFGVIADEKTANLSIKRSYKASYKDFLFWVVVLGLMTFIMFVWLIIKIKISIKDKKIKRAFQKIEEVFLEE